MIHSAFADLFVIHTSCRTLLSHFINSCNTYLGLQGRISPDLTTCSILINAFGRAREWDEVDIVLLEMERVGLQADLTVYNSLLSVYGKAGLLYEVELIVKSLQAESSRLVELGNSSLTFDLITYNTLLDIYGKAGRLNDVIHWFSEMKKAGVQPDVKTFNSLVNAYGKASHFDGVIQTLQYISVDHFSFSKSLLGSVYNLVLKACPLVYDISILDVEC